MEKEGVKRGRGAFENPHEIIHSAFWEAKKNRKCYCSSTREREELNFESSEWERKNKEDQ